jgi:hypothetical protein
VSSVKEKYVVEVTANVVEDHENIIAATANGNKINSSRDADLPLVIHVIVGSEVLSPAFNISI